MGALMEARQDAVYQPGKCRREAFPLRNAFQFLNDCLSFYDSASVLHEDAQDAIRRGLGPPKSAPHVRVCPLLNVRLSNPKIVVT